MLEVFLERGQQAGVAMRVFFEGLPRRAQRAFRRVEVTRLAEQELGAGRRLGSRQGLDDLAQHGGGAGVVAGLNGNYIRMHAPDPLVPGSSVAHFSVAVSPDDDRYRDGVDIDPDKVGRDLGEVGIAFRRLCRGCRRGQARLGLS